MEEANNFSYYHDILYPTRRDDVNFWKEKYDYTYEYNIMYRKWLKLTEDQLQDYKRLEKDKNIMDKIRNQAKHWKIKYLDKETESDELSKELKLVEEVLRKVQKEYAEYRAETIRHYQRNQTKIYHKLQDLIKYKDKLIKNNLEINQIIDNYVKEQHKLTCIIKEARRWKNKYRQERKDNILCYKQYSDLNDKFNQINIQLQNEIEYKQRYTFYGRVDPSDSE